MGVWWVGGLACRIGMNSIGIATRLAIIIARASCSMVARVRTILSCFVCRSGKGCAGTDLLIGSEGALRGVDVSTVSRDLDTQIHALRQSRVATIHRPRLRPS